MLMTSVNCTDLRLLMNVQNDIAGTKYASWRGGQEPTSEKEDQYLSQKPKYSKT